MQQTGIFAGRTEVRFPYARWGWTRGGGKVWHGGLDLAGLDDATIRMPYYKGKRITGRVTRARIVTDRRDKTWEWGYYVCVQLDRGQTPDAVNFLYFAHCASLLVKAGQRVASGDALAVMGNTGQKRRDLYHFLDQEIGRGRQVYLVCPAIENTPDGGLNAVKSYYEDIAKALLPERRVGLMHGKLKPKEKAAVMEDFKAGRLDALVSTTVIEVGVDVPNASVMVIENAERYGLSALHQLRGRVGRGAAESWCFLVSDNQSENVQKRLKFLCSTTDGFAVAQYDLETRGPGDFFGSRQHGLPTLQIADLMNDTRTLHAAQAEAVAMLADDPLLEAPEHALLEQQVQQMFEKAGAMN